MYFIQILISFSVILMTNVMKNMLLLSFAYTEFDFVFFADLLNMRVLMISHKIKLRKSFKIIRFLTKKQLFSKFTLFRSSQLRKSFLHLKWIYLLDSLQGVGFFFHNYKKPQKHNFKGKCNKPAKTVKSQQ